MSETTRDAEATARRAERRQALLDLIADWYADGDEAKAVGAIADAIGNGIAGRVLAALDAYGDVPKHREGIPRRSQPGPLRRGGSGLEDSDILIATGSVG